MGIHQPLATAALVSARETLKQIAYLRPAGDVTRCKEPRVLVEKIERIALQGVHAIDKALAS